MCVILSIYSQRTLKLVVDVMGLPVPEKEKVHLIAPPLDFMIGVTVKTDSHFCVPS